MSNDGGIVDLLGRLRTYGGAALCARLVQKVLEVNDGSEFVKLIRWCFSLSGSCVGNAREGQSIIFNCLLVKIFGVVVKEGWRIT